MEWKIVLPKVEVEDRLYAAVLNAFSAKISNGDISIAQQSDHYPEYYYYADMADHCMTSPEVLERYVSCYSEVCSELCDRIPDAREFVSYIENSFFIYSIREIHTREQAESYRTVLDILEQVIDKNRDIGVNSSYTTGCGCDF